MEIKIKTLITYSSQTENTLKLAPIIIVSTIGRLTSLSDSHSTIKLSIDF
jgi:hypothetical protein